MAKCKYEGTGIWNGRCTGTKEVDPCPGYDKCKQYKPNYTTNAQKIRSMSDGELEEGIGMLSLGYQPWCDHHCKVNGDYNCNRCLRSWLQQPAE